MICVQHSVVCIYLTAWARRRKSSTEEVDDVTELDGSAALIRGALYSRPGGDFVDIKRHLSRCIRAAAWFSGEPQGKIVR